MKKTLILQCPGMVCSPPVVSKCLGEAHRRLGIIYIIYITLHYITLHYITLILFFFFFHTVGNYHEIFIIIAHDIVIHLMFRIKT